MSGWLFDNLRPGASLAILPPSGTCFFELDDQRPLVCLVGGIGITPALSILRSAAAADAPRRVHVDYSASTREDVVCGDELSRLAAAHDTITVHTRITREAGRFGAADLAALTQQFPGCDWLICGSRPFQSDAQRLLLAQGIEPRHLHIESFEPVGGPLPAAPAATAVMSPRQRWLVGYGLLAAVALFVVQALLGIKWPLLDRLQATTAYSALTGSALLLLLILQWHVSYVRWRSCAPTSPLQASVRRAHLWSGRAGRSPKRVEDARERADGSPVRRARETSKAYGCTSPPAPRCSA